MVDLLNFDGSLELMERNLPGVAVLNKLISDLREVNEEGDRKMSTNRLK